VAYEKVMKPT